MPATFKKNIQYYKFCLYGFLKNLKFFEPFFILFLKEKGLSWVEVGTVYSLRMIVRVVFEIPSGIIADTLGRRRSMIFSYIMYLGSFLAYYLAGNYILILAATFIFALGDAFRTGTHKAMIFEYLKINNWQDQKAHYYGHTRSWSQAGSAVSSLIAAGLILAGSNYQEVFLYTGIPYLAGIVLLISYPSFLEGTKNNADAKTLLQRLKGTFVSTFRSFGDVKVLRAVSNLSSHSGYFTAVKDYLQPVLSTVALSIPFLTGFGEYNREAIVIGVVYFVLYFITSYASRNSGRMVEFAGHGSGAMNGLLVTGLLAGGLSGLFYGLEISMIAVVFFVGVYVIENLRRPAAIAGISELFDADIQASVLSVESQVKDLFGAILAFIIGLFAEWLGVGAALVVVSAFILVLMPFFRIKKSER